MPTMPSPSTSCGQTVAWQSTAEQARSGTCAPPIAAHTSGELGPMHVSSGKQHAPHNAPPQVVPFPW